MKEKTLRGNGIRFFLAALLLISLFSAASVSAEAAGFKDIVDHFVARWKVHYNENFDYVYGPIKSMFTKASDATTTRAGQFWESVKGFTGINWIKEKFNQFVEWIKQNAFFGGIIKFFSTIVGAIGNIFSFVPDALEAALANIWIAAFLTGISVAMPFMRHLSANKRLGAVIVIVIVLLTVITLVAAKQSGDEETVKSAIIFMQIVNLLFLVSLPFGKEKKAAAAAAGPTGDGIIKKFFKGLWAVIKAIFTGLWFVLTNIPWKELFQLAKALGMLALVAFGGICAVTTVQALADTAEIAMQVVFDWVNGLMNKLFGIFDNLTQRLQAQFDAMLNNLRNRLPPWLRGAAGLPAPSQPSQPNQQTGAPPAPATGSLAQQTICNQQYNALGGTCADKGEAQLQIVSLTQLRSTCQDAAAIDARFSAILGAYAGCN